MRLVFKASSKASLNELVSGVFSWRIVFQTYDDK